MTAHHRSEHLALAVLTMLAWFGVLLQLWLSLRLATNNGRSIAEGLVTYLGFFTVLTNIFVALVTSVRLMTPNAGSASDNMRGCATTAMLLVGIGYHFLLRNVWAPQGWQWMADLTLHYAVPLASLGHWSLFPPRERLSVFAPLAWSVYPVLYFVYAILRGKLTGAYPYYFIDLDQIGYARTLAHAIGLWVSFIALGFAVRYVARFRTGRHAASAGPG